MQITDGCVPTQIVHDAAKRNNIKLPTECKSADDLTKYMICTEKHNSLEHMLEKFFFYLPIIGNDPIAIKELCQSFAKQQYKNKIYYTEVRYCPHLLAGDQISPEQVLILILNTLKEASLFYGIIIKSLLCCMRSWKADKRAQEIVDFADKYGKNNGGDVVGIDLAGEESGSTSKDGWNLLFKKAKYEKNINITIHAGEACGPESVWDALDNLYADRIGHGYAIVQDKLLMNRLKREQMHLECCPTSSIITNAFSNAVPENNGEWDLHPISIFQQYGINYGINSDDPVVLNCQYQGEIDIIRDKCGFSKWDVANCWIRAAQASFMNKHDKMKLVQQIIQRIQTYYLNDNVLHIMSRL